MRKRKKKYKKKREQKSQKCDISPLCGGAPCEPISTKFVVFVGLINVITCAKNGFKTYIGFSRPTGGKSMFPYRKPTAYITLPCATALACDGIKSRANLRSWFSSLLLIPRLAAWRITLAGSGFDGETHHRGSWSHFGGSGVHTGGGGSHPMGGVL